MKLDIFHREAFEDRHNGPKTSDVDEMLNKIGVGSIDELIDKTVPENIRSDKKLNLPQPQTEVEFLKSFKELMSCLHTLPGGNCTGKTGNADQLPDSGFRTMRNGNR